MKAMFKKTFPLAILAGICISIGCVVNLRVGGVAGAVLFAFGLTTVVYYGLKLYTGTAGFIRLRGDWTMLGVVLLGKTPWSHHLRFSHRRQNGTWKREHGGVKSGTLHGLAAWS